MINGEIFGNAKGITFLGGDPDSMISSEANADPARVEELVEDDEASADIAKTVDLPDANTTDSDPIQFFVLK